VTPVDVGALAEVPVGPRTIRLYLRHCYLPAAGDPNPLWMNTAVSSRWHTHQGTVYVAEDPNTVWTELCRNIADRVRAADPTGGVGLNPANFAFYGAQALRPPVDARALFSVTVSFTQVADFTSAEGQTALQAAGVSDPAVDLLADDYGPCPEIAKAGHSIGWQAVRAPSAARVGGVAVSIFHGAWPPPRGWTLEALAARPTVSTAYLTRYQAGKRPEWLGPPPVRPSAP
jgi:hypothetical protein